MSGGQGDDTSVPAALQPMPADLQDLADAIRFVQQRIQALQTTVERRAELSRELRRAVQIGRHQPVEGRRRLAGLQAAMEAEGS